MLSFLKDKIDNFPLINLIMKLKPKTTGQHFLAIKAPRLERIKGNWLIDTITLTLCAVIGGAETWEDYLIIKITTITRFVNEANKL